MSECGRAWEKIKGRGSKKARLKGLGGIARDCLLASLVFIAPLCMAKQTPYYTPAPASNAIDAYSIGYEGGAPRYGTGYTPITGPNSPSTRQDPRYRQPSLGRAYNGYVPEGYQNAYQNTSASYGSPTQSSYMQGARAGYIAGMRAGMRAGANAGMRAGYEAGVYADEEDEGDDAYVGSFSSGGYDLSNSPRGYNGSYNAGYPTYSSPYMRQRYQNTDIYTPEWLPTPSYNPYPRYSYGTLNYGGRYNNGGVLSFGYMPPNRVPIPRRPYARPVNSEPFRLYRGYFFNTPLSSFDALMPCAKDLKISNAYCANFTTNLFNINWNMAFVFYKDRLMQVLLLSPKTSAYQDVIRGLNFSNMSLLMVRDGRGASFDSVQRAHALSSAYALRKESARFENAALRSGQATYVFVDKNSIDTRRCSNARSCIAQNPLIREVDFLYSPSVLMLSFTLPNYLQEALSGQGY